MILFWEMMLLFDSLVTLKTTGSFMEFSLMAALTAFFAAICIAIEYCKRLLVNYFPRLASFVDYPGEELKTWYFARLRKAYEGRGPVITGLVVAVAGTLSTVPLVEETSGQFGNVFWLRNSIHFTGFFFCGAGLWAILAIISLTSRLSDFRIRVTIYQHPESSVLSMGALFLRMSLAISAVYFLLILSAYFSPYYGSYIVLIWLSLAALAVLAFFVLPQYRIHKIMLKEKRQRLLAFSDHLEDALQKSLRNPSAENMQHLKELFELQQHLTRMNEWTFNANTIGQLISALIIPLLLAFMEIFFRD